MSKKKRNDVEKNTSLDTKNFCSASEAGKLVGYTGDYITKLAREGKIEATRIGRQWVVSPESVKQFATATKAEKAVRNEAIRQERKREQIKHQEHVAFSEPPSNAQVALLQTMVILVLGLVIGTSGYMASTTALTQSAATYEADLNIFESMALGFYRFISPDSATGLAVIEEDIVTETVATPGVVENLPSMVVAPSDELSLETVEQIQESFSDEVEVTVDPENPDTGIVVPIFKERRGDEYRFLMVPNPKPSG